MPKLKVGLPIALFITGLLAGVFLFIQWYHPRTSIKTGPAGIPTIDEFRSLDYQHQLDLIKNYGQLDPIAAWAYLKSAFFVNGQQTVNAHEFAHLIGNAMYAKFGLDGITNCDDTFAYGCFHGVTEQLLIDKGTSVVRQVQDRCTQIFPPDKSQNYMGCIHGMGHGLLTWEHFNVPKALTDCDMLDSTYQSYCYDGVFMEHASDLAIGEFNPKEPWQFCTQLDSKYQYNCARYQSQIFLTEFDSSIPVIGQNCAKTSDETLSATCFESLGYYITQRNTGQLQPILDSCGQIKSIGTYHCIIGATREVTFQAYVGWRQTAKVLCSNLPADWKDKCPQTSQFISPM